MTGNAASPGDVDDDGADRIEALIREAHDLLATGEFERARTIVDNLRAHDAAGENPAGGADDRYRRLRSRHIELLGAHAQLGLAHREAESLSQVDPLTGLHNRRYLEHYIPAVVSDASAGDTPACVAVVDLDGFKRVNDEVGYTSGDGMLREVATELVHLCRHGDGVVRLGGDEFVIVLRGSSIENARAVLERIRSTIGTRPWSGIPPSMRITTSIGFTMARADAGVGQLIDEASQAMQHAKRSGRDRVSGWDEIKDISPDRRSNP